MTRVRVDLGAEAGRAPLEFEINGHRPDFELATERISEWSVSAVDPRLLDLLDLAGAVFAADGMVPRGGPTRPRLGAGWRRNFDIEIEVRDAPFWRRRQVRDVLAETIAFLTGDTVSFRFTQAQDPTRRQDYLPFAGPTKEALTGAHVVLFSGGLDSLAGALETLSTQSGRVVLVTHRSANKIISHQNALAEALRTRFGDRVGYVPTRATRKRGTARDRTFRSRSFLFAAFG